MDTQKLITINMMNRSPKHSWPVSASHRLFNVVLSVAIVMSLNSQAFAQKVTLTPSNKKVAAGSAKTKKLKKSIDQQILAQAQSLQGSSVKIYSDEPYKRTAKAKKARSTVAQSMSTSTFGPSNRVEMDDNDPNNSNANISTTIAEAKKAALPENKVNGSVAITVGHDSNLDEVDREDIEGGFYEMKPSISYEGQTFIGSFGAAIKDYSSQENSAIAKKTDITADLGAKFSLASDVTTTSKISFLNRDFRWPDFLGGSDAGMVIRFFETKFTQSLDFKLDRLTLGVNGSYSNRDFTTTYSDSAPDVLGRQDYQRDLNDAQVDAKVAIKFSDNLSLIGKPMMKHRKYKDEPARQTNGQKGGAALASTTPRREILTNELALDLKASLGAFTITPTAKMGQDIDRALGAEDTSYSGAGLSLEIDVDKDTGFKLGASANMVTIDFDNWTDRVNTPGDKRKVDGVDTGLTASINISKSVSLGIDYSREKYDSNVAAFTDENFTREVLGSTLTVSF